MTDAIAVITRHEAGHAVAALMTRDTAFDDRVTVTVTLINGRGAGTNGLRVPGHPVQDAFIFYAGPWSEARAQWGEPVHTWKTPTTTAHRFMRRLRRRSMTLPIWTAKAMRSASPL